MFKMPVLAPTVSIITICYNSENTVESTIKSVIAQDHPSIEYIIVDGGSTDSTMQIVNKYKERISKIISGPDKGIYDAMNKGIALAGGEIVGILNSDDVYFTNNTVSDVVKEFMQREIDLLYGNIRYFKRDPQSTVRTWITKPYYDGFFENGEVPPHPSLFVKKRVYDQIGSYFPDFKITADYEFMLRALKINGYKSFFLNQFIVNMRMGGESTRNLKNILTGNNEIGLAWKMNNLRPPPLFWPLRILKKIEQYLR